MAEPEGIHLTVRGMTCDGCAQHVTEALRSVAGVQAVQVPDWKVAQAMVVADAGVDGQALVAALEAAGYSGAIQERHPLREVKQPEFFLDVNDLPVADSCCMPAVGPVAERVEATRGAGLCPACGQKGKPVDSLTVKAMLSVSLEKVRPVSYLFCRTGDCPVVYFAEDGGQTFTTADVRERVYQKEPGADDTFVCYCFRHTVARIRAEWERTGHSATVDSINASMQAGQCACDLRNPQGSCCLGNVRAVVKQIGQSSVKAESS